MVVERLFNKATSSALRRHKYVSNNTHRNEFPSLHVTMPFITCVGQSNGLEGVPSSENPFPPKHMNIIWKHRLTAAQCN
jgi:hypothetical protein